MQRKAVWRTWHLGGGIDPRSVPPQPIQVCLYTVPLPDTLLLMGSLCCWACVVFLSPCCLWALVAGLCPFSGFPLSRILRTRLPGSWGRPTLTPAFPAGASCSPHTVPQAALPARGGYCVRVRNRGFHRHSAACLPVLPPWAGPPVPCWHGLALQGLALPTCSSSCVCLST